MDKRYLIVNADDFGMCHAANMAVFDLFESGGIVSSTVMMPCGWSVEACEWAAAHPQYAVGVHLTFTSEWGHYRWGPVSGTANSSLCDPYGYFHKGCDAFEDACDIDEVEAEIRAQVAKAKALGLVPSHLDNHMGSLYGLCGNGELMPKTFEICGEMGYAFRMFTKIRQADLEHLLPAGVPEDMARMLLAGYAGYAEQYQVPLLDYLLFPEWTDELRTDFSRYQEYVLTYLSDIPQGITETFIHPSLESDELKGITSLWRDRVWEHRLFADPKTRQHFESQGIVYASYRDLVRVRAQQAADAQ